MKKYEFTGEVKEVFGVKVRQIKRLSDGLIGGWIEKEDNLSQEGSCFVAGNAEVSGEAQVSGKAQVFGDAQVSGKALIYGKAVVYRNARVLGSAQVSGNAVVSGAAEVFGNAQVYNNAVVSGAAEVYGNAQVSGKVLTCSASRDTITVSDNYAAIGCENYEHSYWLKNIEEIGERNSYSKIEIEEYKSLLSVLIKQVRRR